MLFLHLVGRLYYWFKFCFKGYTSKHYKVLFVYVPILIQLSLPTTRTRI